MKANLNKEARDNIYAGVFLVWLLPVILMLCPLVSMISGMNIFGDLGSSDSFFGMVSVILPAIFLGALLVIDTSLMLGIFARTGLVLSTGRRRAFLIISVLGCLLSAFWSFAYLQWASHGYGSDVLNIIS